MATTSVKKSYLLKLLKKRIPDSELEEALHQIKAPIDSIEGDELQIEVTGDRPDLLSAEGIARSLKGHLHIEKGLPQEKFVKGKYVLFADDSVKPVREFIVAAVVENLSISEDDLKDLIQIQEKLTLTHGRKRKKVAIGLHDMGSLAAPFYYKAVEPQSIEFVPLGKNQKMNLAEILLKHEKGIEYGWIMKDLKKYPIIFDSRNQVLSFPPIINGTLTGLSTDTKSIFIDITGTDFHSCNIALNILCQDFYDRGARVETVEVKYSHKTIITPETTPEKMNLDINYANKLLGIELKPAELINALGRQRISAKINGNSLECLIPRYRADFLHPSDLIEEIALGYGYNSFIPKLPSVFTKGSILPRTKIQDSLADLMVGAGYQQLHAPVLTNQRPADKLQSAEKLIRIKNPVSEEYENIRSSLLPGLMETLSKNTHNTYPQKIFEIGLVAKANDNSDVRASNDLHLAAVLANSNANLAELSGVLLEMLKFFDLKYSLSKNDQNTFIAGRQAIINAKIKGRSHQVAALGEVHPSVLEKFNLEVPCIAFELNVEALL